MAASGAVPLVLNATCVVSPPPTVSCLQNAAARSLLQAYEKVSAAKGQFTVQPVGPLFTQVKCQDEWRTALEACWGNSKQFLVANGRDAEVFERIVGRDANYTKKPCPADGYVCER